ncbi:MAG TPA: MmgE/PrpD family protein [Usitatibacter sp.]|nr:MmgE/PrpD family protein [Usitatibacter sp.]
MQTLDKPAAPALAAFVAGLRFSDLPEAAVEAARRHLLDILGVAIRGRAHENASNALAGVRALDGSAGSVAVWGSGVTLAAPYAALANGIASHVLDYDDTHTDAIVHGSAIVAPVVMALAEPRDAPGEEIVAAFVAGWEVAARVGLASAGTFHQRGFHTTSIAGIFGAAAAAARLLRLDAARTTHAMGLAGSMASGINEYLSNGSSAKSMHTGWSAHSGIVAACLAAAGMTGPESVFEGRDGLLRAYGERDGARLAAFTEALGTRWEVTRVSVKPYPCCHFAHAFIDCAGALLAGGVRADEIERIECVVPALEQPLICDPIAEKMRPRTPYAAKFSLPFLVAARIADGSIGHRTFGEASLARDDVLRLAAKVSYRTARPGEMPFPRTFPGLLEATLSGGRRIVQRLDVNRGHPDNPLAFDEVASKFRDNASATLGEARTGEVIRLVTALPRSSAAELARALAPESPSTARAGPQAARATLP